MMAMFALLAALHATTPELALSPVLVQHGILFRADHATAGGVGGGAGLLLEYGPHWLTQFDVVFLMGFGNTGAARLATGFQLDGWYAPAGFVTLTAVFGHRIDFVTGDGSTRAPLAGIIGARAAALRFTGPLGTISALEPGVGIGLSGGYALELTVLQASLRF